MELNFFPRWLLARLRFPAETQSHWTVLLSTALALLIAPLLARVPHFCLLQTLLGIPCPGCGVLHAMSAMAHWDFADAWRSNPAAYAVAAFWGFQLAARTTALLCAPTRLRVQQFSRLGNFVACGLLLLVWFYRLSLGGIDGYALMP